MTRHPPKIKARALRLLRQTGCIEVSFLKTGINRNTLKTWKKRYVSSGPNETELKPEKASEQPKAQWMQSLHHNAAHLLINGRAACSGGVTGARVDPGMTWFQWDGCLRKCTRCMGHENNSKL